MSRCLRRQYPRCKVVLADPPGSSLLYRVKYGVCYTPQQAETRVRKHRYDSIAEGIGLDRVTANFQQALIDDGLLVSDQNMLLMAHWLLREEGLFVGSSSALNVFAAYTMARQLGPGHVLVTVICDSGQRHLSRMWNEEYIRRYNLKWPSDEEVQSFLD